MKLIEQIKEYFREKTEEKDIGVKEALSILKESNSKLFLVNYKKEEKLLPKNKTLEIFENEYLKYKNEEVEKLIKAKYSITKWLGFRDYRINIPRQIFSRDLEYLNNFLEMDIKFPAYDKSATEYGTYIPPLS